MKLEELEKSQGIEFPELFRKIYDTGAMEWMTQPDSWIDEHREELENAHGTFMWGVEVDWEPLLFDEIEEEQDYISEIDGYTLGEEYTIVPFAHTEGGDIYAFAYKDKEFIDIILYRSDENDIISYGADFEKFLTWQMCFAVIVEEQEIDEDIIAHAQYLNDEHKSMFENKDIELIDKTMNEIEEEMDNSDEDLLNKFYKIED
ncbi:MAG TPA: SMI1/KNR4 family protein [Clostridium sp.]|nr:SMI1/KNR4 family protein [Clostridium sp.]